MRNLVNIEVIDGQLMQISRKLFLTHYVHKKSPTLNIARCAVFRKSKKPPQLPKNRHQLNAVADSGVSGPWGPQFCGALCKGVTQRIPAGVLGGTANTPVGVRAEPRRQTHFGNNIFKLVEHQVSWSQSIPIIPIR